MEKKTSAGASASGANPTEVWEGRERWWWSDEGKQWTRSDEIDPKLINRCALRLISFWADAGWVIAMHDDIQ